MQTNIYKNFSFDEMMSQLSEKEKITIQITHNNYSIKKILKKYYTNDVITLYNNGVSLVKIQKQLSEDAISKELISNTVKQYSRKKGESGNLVKSKTLFSMNNIKNILKENNVNLRKIGRQKNESNSK